jgi:hypothetical protein
MNDTKKLVLAAAVGMFLSAGAGFARADAMTGTLIDNMCGAKKADEAAAAKHTAACASKEGCSDSGYQLIVGDKHYKLDDAGNEKAKAYLKDNKSMKVTMDAKMDGEKLTDVTSIKAAEKDEKEEKK